MKKISVFAAAVLLLLSACTGPKSSERTGSVQPDAAVKTEAVQNQPEAEETAKMIPAQLEAIPDGYSQPANEQGRLEKLTYQTWESFSYEQHSEQLTKEAWVYVPYGYDENRSYNIMYLSHGGWSNETTIMGTDDSPSAFKNVIDHAIEDGKIAPLLIVLPTYNNTSPSDSGSYSLALQLTNNFHNELLNDLMPAAESKYSTYAEDTTPEGFAASRDHRGFGGFSMGSVNTWRTFQYCLDYFRYFMPMSGSGYDGQTAAEIVKQSGHAPEDFFIYAMSGTEDFAYQAFKAQIDRMADTDAFGKRKVMFTTAGLPTNTPITACCFSGIEACRPRLFEK